MIQSITTIVSNKAMPGGYFCMELDAPEIAAEARPGQFAHLMIPGLDSASLRRPLSICDAGNGRLAFLYKTVGRGTEMLSRAAPGTKMDVIGPLGNSFSTFGRATPLLVGGGYGIAPMLFLAKRLGERKGAVFTGGRTAADILLADKFREIGWDLQIATNDGSMGVKGLVTDALDAWRTAHPDEKCEMFACGPDGMLKAVGDRAGAWGCKAWLSLDKHMVCGIGACLACIQKVRRRDGTTMTVRVCKEGPIFESRAIVWE